MYEELTALIKNIGFPIGVSVYLLVRFEQKIEALNITITNLTVELQNLCKRD